jgi:hypothetical protein
MRSVEHRVGMQRRVTVRHCKERGDAVHAQTGPQEIPLAKSDSRDMSQAQVYAIQRTGDMLAGRLDGH